MVFVSSWRNWLRSLITYGYCPCPSRHSGEDLHESPNRCGTSVLVEAACITSKACPFETVIPRRKPGTILSRLLELQGLRSSKHRWCHQVGDLKVGVLGGPEATVACEQEVRSRNYRLGRF